MNTPQQDSRGDAMALLPPRDALWVASSAVRQGACVVGAGVSVMLALAAPQLGALFAICCLAALFHLRRAASARGAFRWGLVAGLAMMVPPLAFFWSIFGALAVLLWLALAVWPALFVVAAYAVERRWGRRWLTLLAPILWMGLEFTRCEWWPLRFTWLTPGFLLGGAQWAAGFHALGVYGLGGVMMFLVAISYQKWRWVVPLIFVAAGWPLRWLEKSAPPAEGPGFFVTGIQWEQASEAEILRSLDQAVAAHPDSQLLVLSEYTFVGPPSKEVLEWCRKNERTLAAGGVESVPGMKPAPNAFYNTIFVISPEGKIVHRQVKAVPIQMMQDGQPATTQRPWAGPAGPVGFAVCYDMNYIHVMDEPVRQGAQWLILPAMDVESWGRRAHELSAQLGAVRAAEYGLPVFRLASSGSSQAILPNGQIVASAPFPGLGEMLHAKLPQVEVTGHLPLDRLLVWPAVGVTGVVLLVLVILGGKDWMRRSPRS